MITLKNFIDDECSELARLEIHSHPIHFDSLTNQYISPCGATGPSRPINGSDTDRWIQANEFHINTPCKELYDSVYTFFSQNGHIGVHLNPCCGPVHKYLDVPPEMGAKIQKMIEDNSFGPDFDKFIEEQRSKGIEINNHWKPDKQTKIVILNRRSVWKFLYEISYVESEVIVQCHQESQLSNFLLGLMTHKK